MNAFRKVADAVEVPILLLFTKVDVFEELLSTHKFRDYFPAYRGYMDSSNILAHLALKFHNLCPGSDKRLFIQVVNATDPKAFREVFEKVESKIWNPRLGFNRGVKVPEEFTIEKPSSVTLDPTRPVPPRSKSAISLGVAPCWQGIPYGQKWK